MNNIILLILSLFLWDKTTAQSVKTIVGKDVWVFKIDQTKVNFYIKGSATTSKPLPEWTKHAKGGINLNMFTFNNLPNGYTKIENTVIQNKIRKDYNGFIVWNEDTLLILDRYADGIEAIMKWPNISQNIRMITEESNRNKWQIDTKKWSVSTLATTTSGNVLFIHSRYPYTMHEYINMLLKANLDIYRMVYLEGGPESGIVITKNSSRMGSYETDFIEHDEITTFWDIPWILCFK